MKKLLLFIIVIGLCSCKEKNIYKELLSTKTQNDLSAINDRISLYYNAILYENHESPETYEVIYSIAKNIAENIKAFENDLDKVETKKLAIQRLDEFKKHIINPLCI